MQALAVHTRVNPGGRITKLLDFNNRLQNTPQITTEFQDWNLELDRQLVQLTGRELTAETIYAGSNTICKIDQRFDWISDLRRQPLWKVADLTDWCIIYPEKFESATKVNLF